MASPVDSIGSDVILRREEETDNSVGPDFMWRREDSKADDDSDPNDFGIMW